MRILIPHCWFESLSGFDCHRLARTQTYFRPHRFWSWELRVITGDSLKSFTFEQRWWSRAALTILDDRIFCSMLLGARMSGMEHVTRCQLGEGRYSQNFTYNLITQLVWKLACCGDCRLPLWYPDEQPLQVSAPFGGDLGGIPWHIWAYPGGWHASFGHHTTWTCHWGAASVDLPLSHLVPPAPTARPLGHPRSSFLSWIHCGKLHAKCRLEWIPNDTVGTMINISI